MSLRARLRPTRHVIGKVLISAVAIAGPVGARIEEIGERHQVRIATIAHAGDGNLHPLLLTHRDDRADVA